MNPIIDNNDDLFYDRLEGVLMSDETSSRMRARGRDLMEMGINNTSTYSTLRSRARVKDRFYDPTIAR